MRGGLFIGMMLYGMLGAQAQNTSARADTVIDIRAWAVFDSYETVADSLARSARERQVPPYRLVGEYMQARFSHYFPLWSSASYHHENNLFQGTRFGICDDIATVAHILYTRLGYPSRIITLDGHVVNEVSVDGAWTVFDNNNGVFYRVNGRNASYADMVQATEPVAVVYDSLTLNLLMKSEVRPGQDSLSVWAGGLLRPYRSPANKGEDATRWSLDMDTAVSYRMQLPPGAKVSFCRTPHPMLSRLVPVTVPPHSQGRLALPFPPLFYAGNLHIRNFGEYFRGVAADSVFWDFLYKKDVPGPDIHLDVENSEEESTVYYAANGIRDFVCPSCCTEDCLCAVPPDLAASMAFMDYSYKRPVNDSSAKAYVLLTEKIKAVQKKKADLQASSDALWAIGQQFLESAGYTDRIDLLKHFFYELYPRVYRSRMENYVSTFFWVCKDRQFYAMRAYFKQLAIHK